MVWLNPVENNKVSKSSPKRGPRNPWRMRCGEQKRSHMTVVILFGANGTTWSGWRLKMMHFFTQISHKSQSFFVFSLQFNANWSIWSLGMLGWTITSIFVIATYCNVFIDGFVFICLGWNTWVSFSLTLYFTCARQVNSTQIEPKLFPCKYGC